MFYKTNFMQTVPWIFRKLYIHDASFDKIILELLVIFRKLKIKTLFCIIYT